MRKNKEPLIQFISTQPGLTGIPECQPKPTKQFPPKWWKSMPSHTDTHVTAKLCPALPDYFSQGYIMPMWTDVEFVFDENTGAWEWLTKGPENPFKFATHGQEQFLNYTDAYFQGVKGNFVFKTISPWRIVTPPGYSILQLPVFYHFNSNFSVFPGVRDTDVYHSTNHQILYHGEGKRIRINRGEPLCQYIPFKREKYNLEIKEADENNTKMFTIEDLNIDTKFMGEAAYRELQRNRDKT
jgi:hypothetical protein